MGLLDGVSKVLNPIGAITEKVNDALGLPKELTAAANFGTHLATGDPIALKDGIENLTQDDQEENNKLFENLGNSAKGLLQNQGSQALEQGGEKAAAKAADDSAARIKEQAAKDKATKEAVSKD